ncbi:ABC-2 type transport system permease protein [Neorhodopirellula lusitana]|uniref:ABC-2 type transport system permease protein n=1 Tax=Neorhodopirellula lusitana TaxID=445327 RepID=A0ABY1PSV7_9BACT|nr:Gldg family protein [Neorhodopirellula lusitana]SMP43936.1 ABC-2 type transport system permease protein [Neorhodopirellula lusitana]
MALNNVSMALLTVLAYDAVFLLILLALVSLLAGTKRAAFAVMKRNFVGYFSNPTGYVFLCIFVFLTSVAAFWPYEFFNSNLATLDQLNYWFPLIMLVFIPAITMSIWAEEKRQGTDELLLTLPADDFDIVIGKYMSAAAIFTASLLFSQLSTFTTLAILTEGALDVGLIFTTYLGYWFVGLTMIAIGMIASFLTGNLTVGFILGALFNAPLAFASHADAVSPSKRFAEWVQGSGIARPFDDFGRGVMSSSSVIYFILVAAVALYACMVLIGRRHWTGGKDGNQMAWHYVARVLALIVFTVGAVMLFRSKDVYRQDMTEGKVSSLADATKQLIRDLDDDRPIVIDAFISSEVPELYAKTRYELVNLLKEFRAEAAKRDRTIEVNLYDGIDLFSEDAALAAERFGIEPVTRMFREKGAHTQKQLILGAAFRSGLEKVTVPIFEYGIPVEYELVRSINTVASGSRKRLGVVTTDARLMGGMVMSGMQMQRVDKHPLIDELAKQYEVEEVDLSAPVSADMYDALIAVQPSSLDPQAFDRLVSAIQAGIPTAIFEDPQPVGASYITATGSPKQAAGGFMGMGGGGPQPKGDIRRLWDTLELNVPGAPAMQGLYTPELVWQQHNPYPNLEAANELWLFIDEAASGVQKGESLSDESEITSGLRQVLAILAGGVYAKKDGKLTHTPLLQTGPKSGLLEARKVADIMSGGSSLAREIQGINPRVPIAMAIEDTSSADSEDADAKAGIKVVYVADTDIILPEFLLIRADPDQVAEMRFQFQNVTFALNSIDWLTGDSSFIEVRNHEPIFASLKMIDSTKEEAASEVRFQSREFQTQFDETIREAQEKIDTELQSLREEVEQLREDQADGEVPQSVLQEKLTAFQIKQENQQRVLAVRRQKMERERDQKIADVRRKADQKVTAIQNQVKTLAVGLPCIPPLLVGVAVFALRRLRERENISKSRLK